mgnify:CR=1 FL=1
MEEVKVRYEVQYKCPDKKYMEFHHETSTLEDAKDYANFLLSKGCQGIKIIQVEEHRSIVDIRK